MLRALINDLAQRVITFNKLEQRQLVRQLLRSMNLPRGARVLDFGCGTAPFAPIILQEGLDYTGYDIDLEMVEYASVIYRRGKFTVNHGDLAALGPFDLILATFCFHHISDQSLHKELELFTTRLLKPGGRFLLIDLLLMEDDSNPFGRLFRSLERGSYLRKRVEYLEMVKTRFAIESQLDVRSHVLSWKGNPVYNDVVVLDCVPIVTGDLKDSKDLKIDLGQKGAATASLR